MTNNVLNNDDGVATATSQMGEDWLLQQIVDTLVNGGLDIPVTLTIGGAVVSGMMISGATYFEELSKSFKSDDPKLDEIMERVRELTRSYKEIYDPSKTHNPPHFIHLKDAQHGALTQGDEAPPLGTGTLWRGRLCSIDGFSLGMVRSIKR